MTNIRTASALLFVPLAIYNSSNFLTFTRFKKLVTLFTTILLFAVIYCFIIAVYESAISGNNNRLFYHQLVSPLNHHAIHFSLLVFFNIILLTELLKRGYYILNKNISLTIIFIFSVFLVLLSSKLILFLFLIFLLFLFTRYINEYSARIKYLFLLVPLILVSILFFTTNPVSNRVKDLTTTNIDLLKQKQFGEHYYFNGLEFRLLQWRFVYEILNEQNRWIQGVTPGDSQILLDQKYSETKMYSGNPETEDRGFFGLNTHNQFLQSLLDLGIIGLCGFVFICFVLIKMSLTNNMYASYFINGALLLFCITDTPLEAQYSILIFLFFPAFLSSSIIR